MKNPFNFAAACYSRELYAAVEGYGGNRLMSPDKAFHWKLLGVADNAYFVDLPLFAYRVHNTNQTSQESAAKSSSFSSMSTSPRSTSMPACSSGSAFSRDALCEAFVECDIARHMPGHAGTRAAGACTPHFELWPAPYPVHLRRNRLPGALTALLALGPIGQKLASAPIAPTAPTRTASRTRVRPPTLRSRTELVALIAPGRLGTIGHFGRRG